MILAAWSLGIGSVWLGTWPQMDRVFAQSKLFDLPNDQIPHSIPKDQAARIIFCPAIETSTTK